MSLCIGGHIECARDCGVQIRADALGRWGDRLLNEMVEPRRVELLDLLRARQALYQLELRPR